jgi:iron-sulfur cluster repair protein YtfE (RIC family)
MDPIARFMQEHDVALEQLASLSRATRAVEDHGLTPDADRRIALALEFIEDEVSVHNEREEDALFPVLERYVEGPTKLLREDHRTLKKEFVKLRRAADSLKKNGRSKRAASSFVKVSRRVIQIFVNHIHKENHILFPLVQKFLTRDALREVARRLI